LDDDVWGKAYQIVTKKLLQNYGTHQLTEEQTNEQVRKLFPTAPLQTFTAAKCRTKWKIS